MVDTVQQHHKNWLLRAENLNVVRQCRKCIMSEFGVVLHLDADNLLPRIEHYAALSSNPTLRRLVRPIVRLLHGSGDDIASFELAHIPVVAPAKSTRSGWLKH